MGGFRKLPWYWDPIGMPIDLYIALLTLKMWDSGTVEAHAKLLYLLLNVSSFFTVKFRKYIAAHEFATNFLELSHQV